MSDEDIIRNWRMGLSKFQVANQYMQAENKRTKSRKDTKKITKHEALAYVEPIIFDYEVSRMRGE